MPNYSESLPELISRVKKAKNKQSKIDTLRSYKNTQVLHTILQGAYHPNVAWELPEGAPPYKKDDSDYGLSPSILDREIRKLVYFTSFSGQLIQKPMKREEIFINMLECMHPSESELIIQMKDKNIDGLDARLVWEAFPNLIPEPPAPVKRKVSKKKKSNGQEEPTT